MSKRLHAKISLFPNSVVGIAEKMRFETKESIEMETAIAMFVAVLAESFADFRNSECIAVNFELLTMLVFGLTNDLRYSKGLLAIE